VRRGFSLRLSACPHYFEVLAHARELRLADAAGEKVRLNRAVALEQAVVHAAHELGQHVHGGEAGRYALVDVGVDLLARGKRVGVVRNDARAVHAAQAQEQQRRDAGSVHPGCAVVEHALLGCRLGKGREDPAHGLVVVEHPEVARRKVVARVPGEPQLGVVQVDAKERHVCVGDAGVGGKDVRRAGALRGASQVNHPRDAVFAQVVGLFARERRGGARTQEAMGERGCSGSATEARR
jgi:hypothetical protein